MKVEIWSDIACPFCYIGKRRFEAALNRFPGKSDVEIVYRSFELDPSAPPDVDFDVHDMLSQKYGMPREQAVANNRNLSTQAKEIGLDMNFDNIVLTNTFDAHRLSHLAAKHGKMGETIDRLYQAYFTNGEHVGDRDTLLKIAEEIGLDRQETAEALSGGDYADNVRADEQEAAALSIRGVPYFVINRKYAVSGAQPTELFLQALEKTWEEERPVFTELGGNGPGAADGAACADGSCTIPEKKES